MASRPRRSVRPIQRLAARPVAAGAMFLAAILLFVMTFVVNTVAEVIRQRLREKYKAV